MSLLVGGVVGLVALGAAKVSGVGEGGSQTASAPPSLYMPTAEPTTTPQGFPDPPGRSAPEPSATPSATPTEKPTKKPKPQISLQAFPLQASNGERINLTGTYPGGDGVSLQIQRFEDGAWAVFPVSANVNGGVFATYIYSGRSGENRFRVVDPGSGKASNPVTIAIS
ncbi:hypothetical protein [Nocardioides mesophilus]|uniref:Uncharacterized protein n=1 Tax=Nocardioides mesophilus TaxID=433659 RepID=A0A7G9RF36_9ACTN|nr:hypothetical protein [Nocardioides mesophilus]QNN54211.1 hypothetical protein H9L09_07630 [Nocardioides mesophilus]